MPWAKWLRAPIDILGLERGIERTVHRIEDFAPGGAVRSRLDAKAIVTDVAGNVITLRSRRAPNFLFDYYIRIRARTDEARVYSGVGGYFSQVLVFVFGASVLTLVAIAFSNAPVFLGNDAEERIYSWVFIALYFLGLFAFSRIVYSIAYSINGPFRKDVLSCLEQAA
jgi:hypothetical protein